MQNEQTWYTLHTKVFNWYYSVRGENVGPRARGRKAKPNRRNSGPVIAHVAASANLRRTWFIAAQTTARIQHGSDTDRAGHECLYAFT